MSILVTLFDPDNGSIQPSSTVLSDLAELISRLARERLQIQNLSVQEERIQRFGQFHLHNGGPQYFLSPIVFAVSSKFIYIYTTSLIAIV